MIPAQCTRGVCLVTQEAFEALLAAHNDQVDEIRDLKRKVAVRCGERGA